LFSASLLDSPDPLLRRLHLLLYRGITSFMDYENGARGQLDAAIEAYLELDRIVKAEGQRVRDALGEGYHSALLGLATACCVRYDVSRELLHGDLRPEVEPETLADLDLAVAAAERAAAGSEPVTRASALGVIGMCYAYRYEDDPRYQGRKTIDKAVSQLRKAVKLAEEAVRQTRGAPSAVYNVHGIRDRLAGALSIRDTLPDLDEAIALYVRNRDEAASRGLVKTAGEAASLAMAYMRRWLITREPADLARAREAHAAAFAVGEATHLPLAFDVAAQWGTMAWKEGWWAEAGALTSGQLG